MSIRRRRQGFQGGLTIRTGLQFWGDASRTPVGAVATWTDKSGNGNDATQGTASARPTNTANQVNGKPALVGDGGDQLLLPSALYSIANGNFSYFAVCKRTSGTSGSIIAGSEGGSSRAFLRTGTGSFDFGANNSAGTGLVFQSATLTNWNIVFSSLNGTTQSVSVNNATPSTNTNGAYENGVNAMGIFSNGAGAVFFTGEIAEVLIYNRALNAVERTAVARYLSSKYGITIA